MVVNVMKNKHGFVLFLYCLFHLFYGDLLATPTILVGFTLDYVILLYVLPLPVKIS